MHKLLALLVVIATHLATPAMADFKTGLDAAQRGDFAVALSEWTALAEKGDGAAQYNLAMLYDKGRGVPQDFKMAEHWYRKSAEQNFIWAQFAMGSLYEKGEGVTQDFKQAAEWYAKAANNNSSNAMNSLGRLYEAGQGVPQSAVVAYALAKLSTKANPAKSNPAHAALKKLSDTLSAPQRKAGDRLNEEISLPGNLPNALEQFKVK